jgi:phosphatidate cytidylyltransferase
MQHWLIWTDWYGFFTILIPVYAFLVPPIAAVIYGDHKNLLARTAETQWGLTIGVYSPVIRAVARRCRRSCRW